MARFCFLCIISDYAFKGTALFLICLIGRINSLLSCYGHLTQAFLEVGFSHYLPCLKDEATIKKFKPDHCREQ